jgi:hypothetical protein
MRRVSSLDVQVLQTAASLENLAVAACTAAGRAAAIRSDAPAVRPLLARTRAQHVAHAHAFNAAVVKAGGKPQHDPDPRYSQAVHEALRGRVSAAEVISLLESLEDSKAQTYTRYASLATRNLRPLFVSVACVEAQHRALLIAVLTLLNNGAAERIEFPASTAELIVGIRPGCCPVATYPTSDASAINEGAVR